MILQNLRHLLILLLLVIEQGIHFLIRIESNRLLQQSIRALREVGRLIGNGLRLQVLIELRVL